MCHLREAKGQLTIAWAKITNLTKKLEQQAEKMTKVEQAAYDLGQKEIVTHLKSQIPTVCQDFCLQTWTEALNAAGVDPTSKLRDLERVFYPLAIRVKAAASPLPNTTVSAAPTHVGDRPLEPDVPQLPPL